jgi:carboxylesterase type B
MMTGTSLDISGAGTNGVIDVPVLASWTADDGSLSADPNTLDEAEVINTFAPYFPNLSDAMTSKILSLYPTSDFDAMARETTPKASAQYYRASRIVRDIDPVCPILAFTRRVHEQGNTDVYLAELNTTRLKPYWDTWGAPYGVSHLSDIPYFFNERLPPPGDNSAAALSLARHYSGSFAAFANTGSPVMGNQITFPEWPRAYDDRSDGTTVLVIGGPFGTGPAKTGRERRRGSRLMTAMNKMKQIILGENLDESDSMAAAASTEYQNEAQHARAIALEQEKLIERCTYIESIIT